MTQINIAILQFDTIKPNPAHPFLSYADMLQAFIKTSMPEAKVSVLNCVQHQFPQHVKDFDAYITTGSVCGVYEELDFKEQAIKTIRNIIEAQQKFFGICFGHQMLSYALGGTVECTHKWGLGCHKWQMNQTPFFADNNDDISLFVSHQDQVIKPAQGVTTFAGSDFCPNAATFIDDFCITFQGHPEFTREYVAFRLNERVKEGGDISQADYDKAQILLNENSPQNERISHWFKHLINT